MQQEKVKVVETHPSKLPTKNRTTLITFLALLLLALGALLRMMAPYFLAVFMGAILALLSYPIYRALCRRHFKSKLAAVLVTLGVLVLVIAPIASFVILAVKQAITIGQGLASNETFTFRSLLERASRWGPVETIIGNPETIERQARGWIQTVGKTATATILSIASNIPSLLLQLALASIACFFFLIDGKKFLSWASDKIPMDVDVRERVTSSFKNTAVSIIWATLAAAIAQSTLMLISFLALGVPAAFLAAGATFIFAWIPIVGSVPVWLAGSIYLYTQGSILKVILMIAFGLITGVVDNFVRPLVLKGRGNMHPLVSLVAIFGGVGLFGIIGVFIGPILAAVVISLLQIWPDVGRRFGLIPPLTRKVGEE